MKLLSDALKEKLMDVRLRDKLLAEGKITKGQVDTYLKSLSDDQDKMVAEEEVAVEDNL